jgi:hypothetical protein
MKKFTKQQIEYLQIAVGLTGIVYLSDAAAETILQAQSEMEKLGGDYTLRDGAKIGAYIKKKYKK